MILMDTTKARADACANVELWEVDAALFRVPLVGDELSASLILEAMMISQGADLPRAAFSLRLLDPIDEQGLR
jgi:hypothetical protein